MLSAVPSYKLRSIKEATQIATFKLVAMHLNNTAPIGLRSMSPTQSKAATEPNSPVLPRRARDAWPLEFAGCQNNPCTFFQG